MSFGIYIVGYIILIIGLETRAGGSFPRISWWAKC